MKRSALNLDHTLMPASTINKHDMVMHLLEDHDVKIVSDQTQLELGRTHLLAHACDAFPDLRQLLHLPENWGGITKRSHDAHPKRISD